MHDESVWLPQKRMAKLFGVQRPAITKHLKTIKQNTITLMLFSQLQAKEKVSKIYEEFNKMQKIESDFDKEMKRLSSLHN